MKYFQSFVTLLNSQTRRTQIAIAAVCMLLGILIVTQLRIQQSASQALQDATESDLSQIVGNFNNEINTLKAEAADLRLQLFKIEQQSSNSSAIMRESHKNIDNLKVIAGLTRVRGRGTRIIITDGDLLLNSYDLVDIVTELRVGGAEAVSINSVRIVANTGITQRNDDIYINETRVSPPYEILAIGDPTVLYEALAIAGGIKDRLSALTGVGFQVTKEMDTNIDSVAGKGIRQ